MSEALTPIEKTNLVELEATIEKNLKSFYEVGFALMQIRDNKLYRESFTTFEAYCKEKWNMTHRYANQLIASSEVVHNLDEMGTMVPKDIPERQLRPLTRLEPTEQWEVYEHAVETAPEGKVTARHIEETIKEVTGYKHTETHPVSDAMFFAGVAIVQLESIKQDDSKRLEALNMVIEWCQKQIKGGNHE
jgi:hypothetical protein